MRVGQAQTAALAMALAAGLGTGGRGAVDVAAVQTAQMFAGGNRPTYKKMKRAYTVAHKCDRGKRLRATRRR